MGPKPTALLRSRLCLTCSYARILSIGRCFEESPTSASRTHISKAHFATLGYSVDLPLTAKTPIPNDWKLVRFQQGQDVRWLPVHREGDSAYVMYRIAPNGQPATLEKAPN